MLGGACAFGVGLGFRRTFLRPTADRARSASLRPASSRQRRLFDDRFRVGWRIVIEQRPVIGGDRVGVRNASRQFRSGFGSGSDSGFRLRLFAEHHRFVSCPSRCRVSCLVGGETKISETSVAAASNSERCPLRLAATSLRSGSGLGFSSGFSAPARRFRFRLWFRLHRDAGTERGLDRWSGRGFEQAASGGIGGAAAGFAFAQRDQRVEHIRAAAAAHVSLSGAQVHGRDDQRQRAFRADGEQREYSRGQSMRGDCR